MSNSLRISLGLALSALAFGGCGGGGSDGAANAPPPSAANTAPTISSLPIEQSVAQDSSSDLVAFGVADAESDADAVSVKVSSSNPDLLPAEAIDVLGNDSSRALLLMPMDGVAGEATITITATDSAGLSSEQSMNVAVTSEQRSFGEMVRTAFGKDIEAEPEETVGFTWVDNPEDDETAFDDLIAE